MQKRRTRLGVMSMIFAVMLMAPMAASAAYSYDGDDYSWDYHSATYLAVCDAEDDGNTAYAKAHIPTPPWDFWYRVDSNGYPGCTYNYFSGYTITEHQTCEDISWWPDHCGSVVQTGY